MTVVTILCHSQNQRRSQQFEELVSGLDGRAIAWVNLDSPPPFCQHPGLLIVDVDGQDQQTILSWIQTVTNDMGGRQLPFLVITDQADSRTTLFWMRNGATDCLSLDQPSRLGLLIDQLTFAKWKRVRNDKHCLKLDDDYLFYPSKAMQQLMERVQLIARSDANVLLTGETGSGKTTIARIIHHFSPRRNQPFCTINCGALPVSLLESELFGHIKGSFTGAEVTRQGRLQDVGRGTLLLDEVDTLSIDAQPKLLRAFDTRQFEAVGDLKSHTFEGRIISATNSPLEELVEEGMFRKDLYYRLRVVELAVPPLRERREDIFPIVDHHLGFLAERYRCKRKRVSRQALDALTNYSWPGNIRQLQSVIEEAMLLNQSAVIDVNDLSLPSDSPRSNQVTDLRRGFGRPSAGLNFQDEVDLIKQLLAKNRNNRSQTAMELGISRAAFYKKLAKYGLTSFQ